MIITAPAKVNLYLKVLDKRRDGYHNIETVFERVDIADRIHIKRKTKGIELSSDIFIVKRPEDNLAYKAARAILDLGGSARGIAIRIEKRIPIAAGLGGGSSDAASVLLGINRLLRLGLGEKDLCGLGKTLGADVPFFLSQSRFAVGTVRGDIIRPINTRNRYYHIIICPNFRLKTKDVYEAFDDLRLSRGLTKAVSGGKINASSLFYRYARSPDLMLYNDLQAAAVKIRKNLKDIIERLSATTGKKAIISGSGPSVFCLFQNRKEAKKAEETLLKNLSTCERNEWQIIFAGTL